MDETCDVAKREQMALVFRFVDKAGCSQERFFDLIHVPNTKAMILKDALCSLLHDAQLVELARLIESGKLQTGQRENQIRSLKRPGDTRWGSHFGSIQSLMELFNAINFVIQDMVVDRSIVGPIHADVDTSFSYLSSFEFIFVLCMMKEILQITKGLGQALQLRSHDIVNVVCQIMVLKFQTWRKLISCVVVMHDINLINSLRSNIFEWRYSVQLSIANYMNWTAGLVRR